MTIETEITSRDDFIVAQALFEAAYLLRTREPKHLREPSNARDMEKILYGRYRHHIRCLTMQHLLKRAFDLGFTPEAGPILEEDLVEIILARDPGATFLGDGS